VPHQTNHQKDPYELFKDKKLNASYFKAFESKCFIHNNGKKNLVKLDARSDKGAFVCYSSVSKTYRVYNKCTMVAEEYIHVIFDKTNNGVTSTCSFDELQISKYIDDEDEGAQDNIITKMLLSTQTIVQIRTTKDRLMTLKLIQKPHKMLVIGLKLITRTIDHL